MYIYIYIYMHVLVALGNSFFGIIVYFVVGATTSIDTLVSQAFGRGDVAECRAWLLRALVVFGLASLPLCVMLATAGPIFNAVGFAPGLSEPAAGYVQRFI